MRDRGLHSLLIADVCTLWLVSNPLTGTNANESGKVCTDGNPKKGSRSDTQGVAWLKFGSTGEQDDFSPSEAKCSGNEKRVPCGNLSTR